MSDHFLVLFEFVNYLFQKECSRSSKIETLTFQSCNFPNNILGPDWLQIDLTIDALSFSDCQLKKIDDEAFSLPFYRTLKTLSVIGNNISTLGIAIFQSLVNLKTLSIHDNVINFAESNLLQNSAGSLQVLELRKSILNANVLKNITGQNPLSKIEIFSIEENSLTILSSDLFKGVPEVRSIYADRSGVKEVMVDAFLPIANSIKQLFMRSNSITTLRSEVLETILKRNSTFSLYINDNPWHCDCSMKWLQSLMEKRPDVVKSDPVCRSPTDNAGIPFTKVNFCNGSEESSSTAISTTTENDSNGSDPVKVVNITCDTLFPWLDEKYSHQLLMNAEYQFTKLSNFVVRELANGSILINATKAKLGFTLIWFFNEDSLNFGNLKSNLKCVKSFRNSLLLKGFKPGTSYTVCLLESEEVKPSPLNCVALITNLEYPRRTWLSNGDKPLIISLAIVILCLLSLFSAIGSYIVVRRNPTLLRGSKRILIVRRRTVNAVVLPEGYEINSRRNTEINVKQNDLEDHDYLTFSQRGRKDSQRSGGSSQSSGASYISGIEPNLIQLATWRIHRLRNSNTQEIEKSPPLPPNRPLAIPSLSYKVEFKENDYSFEEPAKFSN